MQCELRHLGEVPSGRGPWWHLGDVLHRLEVDELQRVRASGVNDIRTLENMTLQLKRGFQAEHILKTKTRASTIFSECYLQTVETTAVLEESWARPEKKTVLVFSSSENAALCLREHVFGRFKEDV